MYVEKMWLVFAESGNICVHTELVGYHHFQSWAVTVFGIFAKFIVANLPGQFAMQVERDDRL